MNVDSVIKPFINHLSVQIIFRHVYIRHLSNLIVHSCGNFDFALKCSEIFYSLLADVEWHKTKETNSVMTACDQSK